MEPVLYLTEGTIQEGKKKMFRQLLMTFYRVSLKNLGTLVEGQLDTQSWVDQVCTERGEENTRYREKRGGENWEAEKGEKQWSVRQRERKSIFRASERGG